MTDDVDPKCAKCEPEGYMAAIQSADDIVSIVGSRVFVKALGDTDQGFICDLTTISEGSPSNCGENTSTSDTCESKSAAVDGEYTLTLDWEWGKLPQNPSSHTYGIKLVNEAIVELDCDGNEIDDSFKESVKNVVVIDPSETQPEEPVPEASTSSVLCGQRTIHNYVFYDVTSDVIVARFFVIAEQMPCCFKKK